MGTIYLTYTFNENEDKSLYFNNVPKNNYSRYSIRIAVTSKMYYYYPNIAWYPWCLCYTAYYTLRSSLWKINIMCRWPLNEFWHISSFKWKRFKDLRSRPYGITRSYSNNLRNHSCQKKKSRITVWISLKHFIFIPFHKNSWGQTKINQLLVHGKKSIFNKYKCFSLELPAEKSNVGAFNLDLINTKAPTLTDSQASKYLWILYTAKRKSRKG